MARDGTTNNKHEMSTHAADLFCCFFYISCCHKLAIMYATAKTTVRSIAIRLLRERFRAKSVWIFWKQKGTSGAWSIFDPCYTLFVTIILNYSRRVTGFQNKVFEIRVTDTGCGIGDGGEHRSCTVNQNTGDRSGMLKSDAVQITKTGHVCELWPK